MLVSSQASHWAQLKGQKSGRSRQVRQKSRHPMSTASAGTFPNHQVFCTLWCTSELSNPNGTHHPTSSWNCQKISPNGTPSVGEDLHCHIRKQNAMAYCVHSFAYMTTSKGLPPFAQCWIHMVYRNIWQEKPICTAFAWKCWQRVSALETVPRNFLGVMLFGRNTLLHPEGQPKLKGILGWPCASPARRFARSICRKPHLAFPFKFQNLPKLKT